MNILPFLQHHNIDTSSKIRAVANAREILGENMHEVTIGEVNRMFIRMVGKAPKITDPIHGIRVFQKVVHDSFDSGFDIDPDAAIASAVKHVDRIAPSISREAAPAKKKQGTGETVRLMMAEHIANNTYDRKAFKQQIITELGITGACANTMIYNATKALA